MVLPEVRTWFHVALVSLLFAWTPADADRECLGRDQCSCVYSDDQSAVILNSLGNGDLTPRFQDLSAPDGNTYSFNPCYPFAEKDCDNAAACMINTVGAGTVIGDPQTATFSTDNDGSLSLGYSAGMGILQVTQVALQCDMSACTPQLTAQGMAVINTYGFTLTSVCACPNGCDENGPLVDCSSPSSSSVGGIVFIAVVLGIILIYLIVGVAFMKFVRKASGTEIIPNLELWKAIGSNIKRGTLFVVSPCRRRTGYTST